jgi:diadenosine tetraphosphate (Ap4A) HIT family hydrolase
MDCFYCEKGAELDKRMLKIMSLPYSTLYLNRNQLLIGRVIIAYKEHKTEIFQLGEEERNGFFKDVSRCAQAIYTIYAPDKINYAIFGDGAPHFHVHLVPKYKGRDFWGGPFADNPVKNLSDDEYSEIIARIKAEIEKQQ